MAGQHHRTHQQGVSEPHRELRKYHDHKYDPITQLDYYRLRAFLNLISQTGPVPGESDFEKGGLPRVFDDDIHASTYCMFESDPKSPTK